MWPGELLILVLVLFGCADYIYFQQILNTQIRQLEPSDDSTRCQTASCKAKRQMEEGVVTGTDSDNTAMNNSNTSLNMKVVEQTDRTIEGIPDEVYMGKGEQFKRKQDLLDLIIQTTTTISNLNHTSPDSTKTTTINLIEKLSSEASKKINTYSTAKHQDSEGDLGKKTVEKEIAPTVNEGEMEPSFTEIIVEERKLLTLPNETTRNSETDVPTEITAASRDFFHIIDASTAKEESENQHENDRARSLENLLILGETVIPKHVDTIVLITEAKNRDSTVTDDLNYSFSYTDFTISKDALNTTGSGTPVITKENYLNLPHSTELYIDKQTTNNMTSNEITESNYLNVNKSLKASPSVGKSDSKTNHKESSAKLSTVITGKIFSTSSVTTAPSKQNYNTNKLDTTQNTASESRKREQVNLFATSEEITNTFNLNQNSVENNLLSVSTPLVETHKTTKTISSDSVNNAITVTPSENSTHELGSDVGETTSTSSVTSSSELNQSSNTAVSGEEGNANSTNNGITQDSASLGSKNSYKTADITDKTNKNEVTAPKTVSFTNTVGITSS